MPELVVRQTLKLIYAAYLVEAVLIVAGIVVQREFIQQGPAWAPYTLGVLALWTIVRHLRRLGMKLTIGPDKLRCETGLLSKSTRTIQLGKVQDVRVDQTLMQRLLGIGSLSIETAGESSRLTVSDIDRPQGIADEILRRSELASGAPHPL